MQEKKRTLQEALQYGETYLAGCQVADAAIDAWLLLEHVTGIRRAMFLAERGCAMPKEQWERYQQLLEKRGSHIPLQHLTGEQEFMGLVFQVSEHVLVPRQDTEILVEEALKRLHPGMRVLDLCTGSGCIAVSLAKLGREISVDASDLSAEALAVAEANVKANEVSVRLIQSDLFAQIPARSTDGREQPAAEDAGCGSGKTGWQDHPGYDMIVSNPPYIRTAVIEELSEEVRLHEPYQALDGKEDGLYFYRRIIREAGDYLKAGGWLLFEIGYDQAEDVSRMLHEAGFSGIRTVKDLAGLDRVVLGKLSAPL